MSTIKNKICLIVAFSGLFSLNIVQATSLFSFKKKYSAPISAIAQCDKSEHSHVIMSKVFFHFKQASTVLIKELELDIKFLKKALKKSAEFELQELYKQLIDLQGYLKKHKIALDAMHYHEQLKNTYQKLFDKVTIEEDIIAHINENRKEYGLLKYDQNYLDVFLKNLGVARRKVSKFEDIIHANYVDIKLTNYVFKIDLVRLRNAILFDKRYKNKI